MHRAKPERFFKGEKIIALRKCAKKPIFTYTDFDCYVSATFFVIKPDDINLKYLACVLNSKLIAFWLWNKGKRQGNNYQIDKSPLMDIPIINSPNNEKEFSALLDKILDFKSEATEISPYTKKIDQLVYKLYDLTDNEIALVEKSVE